MSDFEIPPSFGVSDPFGPNPPPDPQPADTIDEEVKQLNNWVYAVTHQEEYRIFGMHYESTIFIRLQFLSQFLTNYPKAHPFPSAKAMDAWRGITNYYHDNFPPWGSTEGDYLYSNPVTLPQILNKFSSMLQDYKNMYGE